MLASVDAIRVTLSTVPVVARVVGKGVHQVRTTQGAVEIVKRNRCHVWKRTVYHDRDDGPQSAGQGNARCHVDAGGRWRSRSRGRRTEPGPGPVAGCTPDRSRIRYPAPLRFSRRLASASGRPAASFSRFSCSRRS